MSFTFYIVILYGTYFFSHFSNKEKFWKQVLLNKSKLNFCLRKNSASCDESIKKVIIIIKFGTLSGRIGKVVASHAEVARSIPVCAETAPIYTTHEALRGYCP